ncbi:MAG: amino acid ABC transporter permease [Gracilibacteraceae bacterium]|jgi:polar amino acid transport system permease protein/polar amino acid transport system substrate-binding protein|nr:amino acid ABC transporter permease [Gracilibacteraceae bacterium]
MEFFLDYWNRIYASFFMNFIQENRYLVILNGLKITITLSICAIGLGLVLACLTNFFRRSRWRPVRGLATAYVDVIRGTPMVVQLMIIYFVILPSSFSNFTAGVIAFGLNSGAYAAEIIRAGIESVDRGQTEAGRSLGLSARDTMIYIVFPQAIKNILPALANEFIVLIKETSIVGYIGMVDLAKAGDIIRSRTYAPYMPLIGVAIIYYIIVKTLTVLLARFERRLKRMDQRDNKTV